MQTKWIVILVAVGSIASWLAYQHRRIEPAGAKPHSIATIDAPDANSNRLPAIQFQSQDLSFTYDRGDTGDCWPVEPVGGGVALLDFDGDGDLDLFFPQGGPLRPGPKRATSHDTLLRNEGGRRFTDVSVAVGLTDRGYGIGCTVCDYDGDGDPDVLVTGYQRLTLWRNLGGRFEDASKELGLSPAPFALGAAFADFDGDGWLDLFVANYLAFDPAKAPFARNSKTGAPEYGLPDELDGLFSQFYRNERGRRWIEESRKVGINSPTKGMGVVAADFDSDGRVDVFVANDGGPNQVWINRGPRNGARVWFEDRALELGLASNGEGKYEANMGIARGDCDGNGTLDILVSHFLREHDTLWLGFQDTSGVYFVDKTRQAGMAVDSLALTGWGISFADFDCDGHLDAIVANGHIRPWPGAFHGYANPPLLWRGVGRGSFQNVSNAGGAFFSQKHHARGLAVGDLDNDGDLDVAMARHFSPSVVLWNETSKQGTHVRVRLAGKAPNRDAIGARVTLRVGDHSWVKEIDGGGGYLSSSTQILHFGLGEKSGPANLTVNWPKRWGESNPSTVSRSDFRLEDSQVLKITEP